MNWKKGSFLTKHSSLFTINQKLFYPKTSPPLIFEGNTYVEATDPWSAPKFSPSPSFQYKNYNIQV